MTVDLACKQVAGWNAALLMMTWTLWVLPLVLLVTAFVWARMAWRGWRTGCFPPADAVLLVQGYGDRTWRGRLQAGLAMLVLPMAVWVLVLSIQLHQSLLQGRSAAELTARLEQGCPRP